MLTTLALLLAELGTLLAAAPAAAQEVKPPLTVDGPGPCRRIGGEWLQPGYCELTGPLRVAPDDTLVFAVGAFLLGPVDVEGGLEVRGATSLVFFFGELANRGRMAVLDGGVAYVAGRAESPGAVDLSGEGRMEVLSDSGALTVTGRFDVAADGRLDVYGAFDNQGLTTNLGVLAVWCGGSQLGPAPQGLAAQVQDCHPPEVSLVSRTPPDASGWNRGTVTIVWACSDGESGVLAERVTAVLSGDGAEQSAFGVCTDLAGNTAAGVVTGINIERPAPRTRRQPAPPVVVHIEPAAPAPPPPPPPPPGASAPAPVPPAAPSAGVPQASGTPLIPENGPLPGPAITDPVSSPDPAPGIPEPSPAASTSSTSGPVAPSTVAASTSVSTPAGSSTAAGPSTPGASSSSPSTSSTSTSGSPSTSSTSTSGSPSTSSTSTSGTSVPADTPTSGATVTPGSAANGAPSVATGTTVWATTTASAPAAGPASSAASVGAAAGIAATTTTSAAGSAGSPTASVPVAPSGG